MDNDQEYLPLSDIQSIHGIISKITIFAGLTEKQLEYLFNLLEKVSFKSGQTVFAQGAEPSYIYVIISGRIKLVVTQDQTTLELIVFEQGHCFGESSIIGVQRHGATAIAIEDTELIVLSRNALLSIYKSNLELFSILILNIARETCRRLHNSDEVLLHYVLQNEKGQG